jgi:hypothetical protein
MTNLTLQVKDARGHKKTISRASPVPVRDGGLDALVEVTKGQAATMSFWFSLTCGLLIGLILISIFKR